MQEPKEITIVLKDSEKKITHQFLIYNNVTLDSKDTEIRHCINEAKKSFDGNPESIIVKCKLVVQ